jgi:hypothetical protein
MDRAPKGWTRLFRKRLGRARRARQPAAECVSSAGDGLLFPVRQPMRGCGPSAEKETVTQRTSPCRTLPATGFRFPF